MGLVVRRTRVKFTPRALRTSLCAAKGYWHSDTRKCWLYHVVTEICFVVDATQPTKLTQEGPIGCAFDEATGELGVAAFTTTTDAAKVDYKAVTATIRSSADPWLVVRCRVRTDAWHCRWSRVPLSASRGHAGHMRLTVVRLRWRRARLVHRLHDSPGAPFRSAYPHMRTAQPRPCFSRLVSS